MYRQHAVMLQYHSAPIQYHAHETGASEVSGVMPVVAEACEAICITLAP